MLKGSCVPATLPVLFAHKCCFAIHHPTFHELLWLLQLRAVATAAAAVPEVYKEGQDPEIAAFQQHQKTAARPSAAEDARTLMALAT
jgi:hypothetical protein